jgi:NADH-quinone oxidoreductase subunit F
MLEILERITQGRGEDGDIEKLEELAGKIKDGSMCGPGQTAPNPVLTTIRHFRNEYEDHIYRKACTAHYCRALIKFSIGEACTGCTACVRSCPVAAIEGSVKKRHAIDGEKCTRCGRCEEVCRFGAVARD